MAESVLRGMAGESGVFEAAYVASSVTELPYFATKVCRSCLFCNSAVHVSGY